jgi:hypothetical protein
MRNLGRRSGTVIVAVGLVVGTTYALFGAADKEPAETRMAKEIAKEWRFVDQGAKDAHFVGIAPQDSQRLYTETGAWTSGASFEEIWNFYARKCGSDRRYAEETTQAVGAKAERGEYVLLDSFVSVPRTTTFGLTTDSHTVSVLLWLTGEKDKVYCSITVATR